MFLYLIRHADAVDLTPDAARPLSARGREEVRALAEFLKRGKSFQPAEVWHSTLLRARETAELLIGGLKLEVPCRETNGLEPLTPPQAIARKIDAARHALAIVGHEPFLSTLATLLVAGRTDPAAFVMNKAAALALERVDADWIVRWHVSPSLFP